MTEEWNAPINASVSKLTRLGKHAIYWQAGVGYWVETPEYGAEGWRYRLQAQLVIPKKQ